jgi:hypothetical protein
MPHSSTKQSSPLGRSFETVFYRPLLGLADLTQPVRALETDISGGAATH